MIPLAHGIATRADLPIPLGLALVGSGTAVAVSFVALLALWRTPRLRGDAAGVPLPTPLARLLDSAAFRWALRLVVLVAALVVVAAALLGPQETLRNVAPWAFYITFWVGLVAASVLLGPVWRVVNPLRTLYALLRPLTGPPPAEGRHASLGYWPAAASLLAFTWLELAYSQRQTPSTVGVFLVLYAVIHLVAALWVGDGWFERGDGFEVYSSLLGRLSVLGRRDDGRLVLRNPLDGMDGIRPERGLAAVAVVLVGGTAFDGVTRTSWWQNGPGLQGDAVSGPATLWLVLTVLAVGALYAGSTALAGLLGGHEGGARGGPARFAHSLVPIAAGYAVAHYASLLLLEGQNTWILGSDPLAKGWDLLGRADDVVDYTVISPETTSYLQVGAIVLGHVLGVVLAHDRAVRDSRGRRELLSQLPLLVVMVGFTVGGLALLLNA